MSYTQTGYPGTYPHQDGRFGQYHYNVASQPPHQPHSMQHPAPGTAMAYGPVDVVPPQLPNPHPTYARQPYHETSAGGFNDHGAWQPPQAPRLSAAAARAGRLQPFAYGVYDYPQAHVQAPYHPHLVPMTHQHQHQQPRTHQQLEQQLLMQHELAKAQESQYSAQAYHSQHGFHPHHHQNHYEQQQQQYQHQRHASSHLPFTSTQFPEQQPLFDQFGRGYPRHPRDHRSHADRAAVERSAIGDWEERASAWPGWQQQPHHRASVPHLGYASHLQHPSQHRYSADWADTERESVQYQTYARQWSQPSHPTHQQNQASIAQHAVQRAALQQTAQEQADAWHMQQQTDQHRLYAAHHANAAESRSSAVSDLRYRVDSDLWKPRPEPHRTDTDRTIAVDEDVTQKPDEVASSNQDSGPAPPSPDTLDKSAVPIAAIGAQLIWVACTALFDPDLLNEAHEAPEDEPMEDDMDADATMSPAPASIPSSSSTPSLNTPDISPWASTVLDNPADVNVSRGNDWNAFRSPFGPERIKQIRGEAQALSSGTEPSFDLHRMAVGAERVKMGGVASPTRSRQSSGTHSEAATGTGSGASTASSSEPGTPSSAPGASPTLSSTVSARSAAMSCSTSHASIGMSLDRSRSESAIRSFRSRSKSSTANTASSSRWSSRIKDNVLAVLRLVSVDWRWSNNDHQLVSLNESYPASATSNHASKTQSGTRPGRDSVTGIVTSYANEPSPAFRRFAHQVLAQTLLSPTAFLLGILNALRLPLMARLADGSIDPVVMELFAQPTSAAPFKLFTLGMMIANKHLDDNTFLNKTWNEVTRIPLAELNQIEAWFLKKCNYEVTVPDDTWIGFLNRLQCWEERRSSHGVHRDQDCSKRLLLVLDEALSHFDAIPSFRLDQHAESGPTLLADAQAQKPMPLDDSWGRPHLSKPLGSLNAHHQYCQSAPAVAALLAQGEDVFDDERSPLRPAHLPRCNMSAETSTALLRSRSDYAASNSSKTISPASDSGKSQSGPMSGPLMPSTILTGSRALLHGSSFVPLATAGWAHS